MSIQPPDPMVIQAHLNAANAARTFTVTESQHYNNPNTMQVEWGIPDAPYTGAQQIMDPHQQARSPFEAMPVAGSRAEFYEAIQVFDNDSDFYLEADDPLYPAQGPAAGWQYQNLAVQPMPYSGPAGHPGTPADITEVPTSTTNPDRPRTVAAGYDKQRQCLTVVFRDGTYYNYYEVDNRLWQNFKRARSKGRFIYTYLDQKPRGVADVAQLPANAREALYRVVRTGQIKRQGVTGTQKLGSQRGTFNKPSTTYAHGNLGGTGRARIKRTTP